VTVSGTFEKVSLDKRCRWLGCDFLFAADFDRPREAGSAFLARVGCDHAPVFGKRQNAGQRGRSVVGLVRGLGKGVSPSVVIKAHAGVCESREGEVTEFIETV